MPIMPSRPLGTRLCSNDSACTQNSRCVPPVGAGVAAGVVAAVVAAAAMVVVLPASAPATPVTAAPWRKRRRLTPIAFPAMKASTQPYLVTTMVPLIGWYAQWYLKVPTLPKVITGVVAPGPRILFVRPYLPFHVTVCGMLSALCH